MAVRYLHITGRRVRRADAVGIEVRRTYRGSKPTFLGNGKPPGSQPWCSRLSPTGARARRH